MESETVELPLLPLRDIIVFPFMVLPLFVGRDKSVRALEKAMAEQKNIFLVAQKNPNTNEPTPSDLFETGTIANILQILKLTDGTMKVLVEGLQRGRIQMFRDNSEFNEVDVLKIEENSRITPDSKALMRSLGTMFDQYVKLNQKIPLEASSGLAGVAEPNRYADTIASYLVFKTKEKQDLLEVYDPSERLKKLLGVLKSELEIMKIEKRVHGRVRKQMERSQKEFYLNEQIKAIQKELGKRDEFKTDIDELNQKIKKAKMPKDVHAKSLKEIKRLEMMQPMSAEATVVRNYIEWLVDLPWKIDPKGEKIDVKDAKKILDEDHYGLEKIKERILEYLAVMKLTKKIKGPILCLVGPPGVGKTSLGQSIARSMGRKFVRISLGGVRDEAEIRGHRRTYIGALPGKIIQGMKKAGTINPVFLLDEVDKMSTDFRGDPSSALLEVLDPEQNHTFNDHYMEVDYDLSHVLFVATANVLHTIPQPLQDRMEIIRLPGYTELEKQVIAEKFLIPKKLEDHGLAKRKVNFPKNSIRKVIQEYTREAGVRSLDREIAALCRKIAKQVVENKKKPIPEISPAFIKKHLGTPPYKKGPEEKVEEIGVANGLAWTEFGGELLTIEVATAPGKGQLALTGKLGDVMKESAHAALSYVRSRADDLGLKKDFYQKQDFHIHLPEGAIPKDGPSAGITMACALVSALTGWPVNKDVSMTGEVTLTGKVLPIGGLKEKAFAAHRSKIPTILIPKENEKDLADIPAVVKRSVQFISVTNMDDVIENAFEHKFNLSRKKTPPRGKPRAGKGNKRPGAPGVKPPSPRPPLN